MISMELVLDNKKMEMEYQGTIEQLLKELKVMREEVVIKVNGELSAETTEVGSADKVEIIKVVFGG
ncbi:MoaD/ThiS family protein [Candidatus Micrarchaeota archaeon]|nr:MoaD/ThiS family protein [Candidatus Micrarchaeota archaeon]MBU1681671.1 MoaD/ThiS family protein [Candidatus Micrarchaeota archaeon]